MSRKAEFGTWLLHWAGVPGAVEFRYSEIRPSPAIPLALQYNMLHVSWTYWRGFTDGSNSEFADDVSPIIGRNNFR